MKMNIAIDGPAGAGKSTIAKLLAKELGFIYVDTGALYRSMALYFLRKGVKSSDADKISELSNEIEVGLKYIDGAQHVYLNGEDVSGLIRTEEVSSMTSAVSVYPKVRERLLDTQRNIAANNDVIMDGRDIGTNILPNAELKIYLTASIESRAERRYKELKEKGQDVVLDRIKEEIAERDERDKNRETAPLKQAEDAIYLDTSDMTIDEVVDYIKKLAKK
ncbi:MAG: (d)CMP kinase [Eubacterium sp.]|nr:(d)CMP kinase [Eubacterium sp.]